VTGTDQAANRTENGARRSAHPAVVLLIIAGAQLMIVLDATIVNIALPSMGGYFHKNQTDMTWALNAYTLAFGGLLLLGGRLGDILERRRMFIVGLGLFTLGSFLGGLATNFEFLLFGRVVQGLGGAIASPTALSLITTSFEEGKERNRAISVYAAVSGAGAALGLLLGGVLTQSLSWRWVLFVNLPIGAVLMGGAFMYLHESPRLQGKFDIIGTVLSVAGMLDLVYAFIHVAHDGWGNTSTYTLFPSAVILLVAFVFYEAKMAAEPLMPMRIFENRSRSGAYFVMLVVGAAMFGMFYFITFFTQQVLGYGPLKCGLAFLPVALTIGVTSQVVAGLLPKLGPKALIAFGTTLLTVSMLWLSRVSAASGYLDTILPGMIVLAISMGFVFVPITSVAVSKVQDTDAGLASALLNVGQQVGGAIGLSVLATVFATAARDFAKSNLDRLNAAVGTLPGNLQGSVGQFLKGTGENGPQPEQVTSFVKTQSPTDQPIVSYFFGPKGAYQHMFASHVEAHGAGMGFLAAAAFAIVAAIVAWVVINVKKEDLPTGSEAMVAV